MTATQAIQKKLSDSTAARWTALLIVSFTMMCGYFVTDVISPLKTFVTSQHSMVTYTYVQHQDGKDINHSETVSVDTIMAKIAADSPNDGINPISIKDFKKGFSFKMKENGSIISHNVTNLTPGLGWSDSNYGFFSGSYSYINVFLLMLFFGGLILDKFGVRNTGVLSSGLMLIGVIIKWWAFSHDFGTSQISINLCFTSFSYPSQVFWAAVGFAIFGVGCEICGITVSKIIVKWFEGKELALAMGVQVGLARLGTAAAMALSPLIAIKLGGVSRSVFVGVVLLLIGLLIYFVYCIMDVKEDKSRLLLNDTEGTEVEDENFRLSDLKIIMKNSGFWLIALLCLMFYGAIMPFFKYAAELMTVKYHISADLAGVIPSLLPIGTIFLTPIFGIVYDKIGKGVSLMLIGSIMLTAVHLCFAMPFLNYTWFALLLTIILGIAFALVPSAMWPSVPKIIPMKQLGSAYAIIFYIQNIGLGLIPVLIGYIITKYANITDAAGKVIGKNYSIPMSVFALFGVIAIILSILLYIVNKKKHYGLQEANIKK